MADPGVFRCPRRGFECWGAGRCWNEAEAGWVDLHRGVLDVVGWRETMRAKAERLDGVGRGILCTIGGAITRYLPNPTRLGVASSSE